MQKISEVARVELLAPAGKWDVLEAVIGAGADAVSVSYTHLDVYKRQL